MPELVEHISHIGIFNHVFLTLLLLATMVLIARSVVAGTRYSSILIIVVFGLAMGFVLVQSGTASPGLPEFPLVGMISRATIIALVASFFVGGQELRKLLGRRDWQSKDIVVPSDEEVILGTKRTQLIFLIRSFFVLMGIDAIYRILSGVNSVDELAKSYILLGYIGVVVSLILIDHKARIQNKQVYLIKGLLEIVLVLGVLLAARGLSLTIKPLIALPQIFFAMILSCGIGMLFCDWKFGPTIRALLFAGIPVVLAGNFLIGGSRIWDAFQIQGMKAVMMFGFFGQLFWMFAGIALLILFGKANHVRNLAPGMAGSLSHAGLTGACTAGDLGTDAALRAPIMINVPFFGHIFVFSILAASAQRGVLLFAWALPVFLVGVVFTVWSLWSMCRAAGDSNAEVKGLMQFSFGWQITAVFGSFNLLNACGMPQVLCSR